MSTKHSIKNEVVQMIFFVFQIVIGSMALSHFALDLWTFLGWSQDGQFQSEFDTRQVCQSLLSSPKS